MQFVINVTAVETKDEDPSSNSFSAYRSFLRGVPLAEISQSLSHFLIKLCMRSYPVVLRPCHNLQMKTNSPTLIMAPYRVETNFLRRCQSCRPIQLYYVATCHHNHLYECLGGFAQDPSRNYPLLPNGFDRNSIVLYGFMPFE
jgi:hypothetical protein